MNIISNQIGAPINWLSEVYSPALIIDNDDIASDIIYSNLNEVGITDITVYDDGFFSSQNIHLKRKYGLIIIDISNSKAETRILLKNISKYQNNSKIIILTSTSKNESLAGLNEVVPAGTEIIGAISAPLRKSTLFGILALGVNTIKPKSLLGRDRNRVFPSRQSILASMGNIELRYQPKISINTGKVVGCEAIPRIRIDYPEQESDFLVPQYFYSYLDKPSDAAQFRLSIINHHIASLAKLHENEIKIPMSIHLINADIVNKYFLDLIIADIEYYDIAPEFLIFEISELCLFENATETLKKLSDLRAKGFGISVDDFGPNQHELEKLSPFPFSELRIDKSIISSTLRKVTSSKIIDTCIFFCKSFNMTIAAEDVDSNEENYFIKSRGFNAGSGKYWASAMSSDEFIEWYELHNIDGAQRLAPSAPKRH